MDSFCFIKEYSLPAPDVKEILRYAGVPKTCDASGDAKLQGLLLDCLNALLPAVRPAVISRRLLPGDFTYCSKNFDNYIKEAEEVILFVATIGHETDRLIKTAQIKSPAKANMYQAIGTWAIEETCDLFCDEIKSEKNILGHKTKPRFSPGFGDFFLENQREIFRLVDAGRIGVSLTDSLLMVPSKSVSAFIAVTGELKPSP